MDGKLMKTRNRAAAVVCGVLCLAVWLVWSGAYRQIRGGEEEKLTVGVFSDSYWDVQNGYSYKIVDDKLYIVMCPLIMKDDLMVKRVMLGQEALYRKAFDVLYPYNLHIIFKVLEKR